VSKGCFGSPIIEPVFVNGEFKVLLVSGPDISNDFHSSPNEIWYYQLEGTLVLKIIDGGTVRSFSLCGPNGSGDNNSNSNSNNIDNDKNHKNNNCFLLEANIPHLCIRANGSIGLVIEKESGPTQYDNQYFVCRSCGNLIHQRKFQTNQKYIDLDLSAYRQKYYSSSASLRTCSRCKTVDQI